MRGVPSRLIPLVPLFCRSLTQMGTRTESFVELTERLGRVTGGVGVSPLTSDIRGVTDPAAYVIISGKAMSDKTGNLLEIFRDILLTARLDDKARFRQVFDSRQDHQHISPYLFTLSVCLVNFLRDPFFCSSSPVQGLRKRDWWRVGYFYSSGWQISVRGWRADVCARDQRSAGVSARIGRLARE